MLLGLSLAINRRYSVLSAGGIPPDVQGAIGDVYLDTGSGIWYEKRWVANREGAGDSILFPINLFPSVGDFDFSVRVRMDIRQDSRFSVSTSAPTSATNVDFRIDAPAEGDVTNAVLRGTGLVSLFAPNPTDQKWHTHQIKRSGIVLTVLIDGVVKATNSNTSTWTPSFAQPSTFALASPIGASASIKCCDLRLTGPGGSIIAPLNEGTGTVITNQSGANGTLTDGSPTNFWYAAWVPITNPSLDFRIPTNSGIFPALFS